MKPPIACYGGKTTIAAKIADVLPRHGHYVEPFRGSLAVLLAKLPSRMETVNDFDQGRDDLLRPGLALVYRYADSYHHRWRYSNTRYRGRFNNSPIYYCNTRGFEQRF